MYLEDVVDAVTAMVIHRRATPIASPQFFLAVFSRLRGGHAKEERGAEHKGVAKSLQENTISTHLRQLVDNRVAGRRLMIPRG